MVVKAGSEPVVESFDITKEFQVETVRGLLHAHNLARRLDWDNLSIVMIRETIQKHSLVKEGHEAMTQWLSVPAIPSKTVCRSVPPELADTVVTQDCYHAIRPKGIPFILESGGLKWGSFTGQSGGVEGISSAPMLHTALGSRILMPSPLKPLSDCSVRSMTSSQ